MFISQVILMLLIFKSYLARLCPQQRAKMIMLFHIVCQSLFFFSPFLPLSLHSSFLPPPPFLLYLQKCSQLFLGGMEMYIYIYVSPYPLDFSGGSVMKNPPVNAGDSGSIPGLGRSPGEGNGNPLQYSYLENPTNRGV